MNRSVFLYSIILVSILSLSIHVNLGQTLLKRHRNRRSNSENVEISGYISFERPPHHIPPNSNLKVQLVDARVADEASITLADTLVDISGYKNGTPLFYNITSKKPVGHGHYNVAAVLNMGWKPAVGSDDWIRNGDYHTATLHGFHMNVTTSKHKYVKNITLELFHRSTGNLNTSNSGLMLVLVFFSFIFLRC